MKYFYKKLIILRILAIACLVGATLMIGTAVESSAKTYVEIARDILRNLPEDAQIRGDLETVLLSQANSYRATKGLGALKPSKLLQDAARAHAADMMLNNFMGHRSSSGYEFDSRVRYFLGNPMRIPQMAENAARDTQKGEADRAKAGRLFQQWVHSASHRKTLVNSGYRYVSTGVVQRGNKIWAVQIFFAEMPSDIKPLGTDGLY
jgi:uncharacterized protein YkwD